MTTDQRGLPRPLPGEGLCDIGAYEAQLPVVTSIERANPDPSSAASVDFIVTFSSSVNGVDNTAPYSDFALSAAGITGAAITGVSGSGSTYTVSVSTGTGVGTLRLDVSDDDTIVDASSGKPLGGPGAGNGNYIDGQSYTIQGPVVTAITCLGASPTDGTSVNFAVTFSAPVTGVDTAAPFGDFILTATGFSGASLTSVSGSGSSYSVTVNTGTGTGTLRLDVTDDDTILDATSGRPLGGPGLGNGNFTGGQVYVKGAMPQSPNATIWDTTPTFRWSKVLQATKYRLQLMKGTRSIYTLDVAPRVCSGLICSKTPTTLLGPGNYSWRVKALLGGKWQAFSPYQSFTLTAPKAGLWTSTGLKFYVAPSRVQIDDFAVYVSVSGCGKYKVMQPALVPIKDGSFSSSGRFYFTGTFDGSTPKPANASGTLGFDRYLVGQCAYITGGPYSWTAAWKSIIQPALAGLDDLNTLLALPAPEDQPGVLTVEPVERLP